MSAPSNVKTTVINASSRPITGTVTAVNGDETITIPVTNLQPGAYSPETAFNTSHSSHNWSCDLQPGMICDPTFSCSISTSNQTVQITISDYGISIMPPSDSPQAASFTG